MPESPYPRVAEPGLESYLIRGFSFISKPLCRGWESLDRPFESPAASISIRVLFAMAVIAVIFRSFTVPDALNFQRPDLARIFFWHFPCPIIASILLLQGAWWAFRYIKSNDHKFDVKSVAALELGFVFAVLTMLSGVVFSKAEWGAWWQWDPRQTSFLLVLLIYGAYFILRGAYREIERRALYASAYILAAIAPAMFLIFLFPRLPQIAQESLHPTSTIMSGQLHGGYAQVIMMTLTVVSIFAIWLFRLRVRAGLMDLKTYE